jgi:hypothetical protein
MENKCYNVVYEISKILESHRASTGNQNLEHECTCIVFSWSNWTQLTQRAQTVHLLNLDWQVLDGPWGLKQP